MMRSAKRLTMITLGFVALSTGSLALAHEDHDALGAGSGAANSAAPAKADDHMAMGSMTSSNTSITGDDMAMGGMHDEGANKNKSFGERLVSWLGRVHTMVIHFPIAMFIGAFTVGLFGLWCQNRDYKRAAHVMLVVGSLGAIVAAFLGWFAGGFYLWDRNPILTTRPW